MKKILTILTILLMATSVLGFAQPRPIEPPTPIIVADTPSISNGWFFWNMMKMKSSNRLKSVVSLKICYGCKKPIPKGSSMEIWRPLKQKRPIKQFYFHSGHMVEHVDYPKLIKECNFQTEVPNSSHD